jgi:proline iminopeptidase
LLKTLLFAAALCSTYCAAGPRQKDIFSTLQENVWYLKTDGPATRLYVTEIGKGSPVVFLHGGPGNDFNYIVDALRPQLSEHRFILFDQRGSVLSPVPPETVPSLSLDVLVEDLERLRQAIGEEKMTLLAHSFGTVVAEAYFIKYPQHVRSMVLTASSPPVTEFDDVLAATRPRMKLLRERPLVAAVLQQEHLTGNTDTLTDWQRTMRGRIRDASIDIVHLDRWRKVYGGGVYYNGKVGDAVAGSLPARIDILASMRTHPVPITVIDGDQDFLDPAGQGWKQAAAILPSIKVEVLPSAGHYGWIDAPKEFAKYLRAGLSRSDSSSTAQ